MRFYRGCAKVTVMITITTALATEHVVFAAVFDEIERTLPNLTSLGEVKMLSGLVEKLLRGHGETETDLAYVALDHALDQRGQLDQLHQDHHEIDTCLRRVREAVDLSEARGLLKGALQASRLHFLREERSVFPLIEQVLDQETLAGLGTAWKDRQQLQRG